MEAGTPPHSPSPPAVRGERIRGALERRFVVGACSGPRAPPRSVGSEAPSTARGLGTGSRSSAGTWTRHLVAAPRRHSAGRRVPRGRAAPQRTADSIGHVGEAAALSSWELETVSWGQSHPGSQRARPRCHLTPAPGPPRAAGTLPCSDHRREAVAGVIRNAHRDRRAWVWEPHGPSPLLGSLFS